MLRLRREYAYLVDALTDLYKQSYNPSTRLLLMRRMTLWVTWGALAFFDSEEREPVHDNNAAVERKRQGRQGLIRILPEQAPFRWEGLQGEKQERHRPSPSRY
jgi:hypothetical protein